MKHQKNVMNRVVDHKNNKVIKRVSPLYSPVSFILFLCFIFFASVFAYKKLVTRQN